MLKGQAGPNVPSQSLGLGVAADCWRDRSGAECKAGGKTFLADYDGCLLYSGGGCTRLYSPRGVFSFLACILRTEDSV